MEWKFSTVIFSIGKFFFWLSLLMIVLVIVEFSILPNPKTSDEESDFYQSGRWCQLAMGDLIIQVFCTPKYGDSPVIESNKSLVESILNIPIFYVYVLIFAPFLLFVVYHYVVDGYIHSFVDLTPSLIFSPWLIAIFSLWLIAIISMCYYIWKSGSNIYQKFRND